VRVPYTRTRELPVASSRLVEASCQSQLSVVGKRQPRSSVSSRLLTENWQLTIDDCYRPSMRAVIQRVTRASVQVEQEIVSQIGRGLLVLLGVEPTDSTDDVLWLAGKISRLRIFPDETGVMNLSVQEIAGDLLAVSQFTLFASTRKGNRPSFLQAAAPEKANQLYEDFCKQLETEIAKPVRRGIFGAKMQIDLLNDGPVTFFIDTKRKE
jgi:D-tyrosyl-tRNA(Tyr) deacylase